MRLDELGSEPVKKVVFSFGRMNPPHYGHGGLIQTLQKVAQQQGAHWYLFVSVKNEPEKNPLNYEQKCYWIKTLFPEVKGHLIEDQTIKTPLIAATWLYKQGFRAATFVAGEDDMEEYAKMIKSGNNHGINDPQAVKSGRGFVFKPLDFAISARLASATNARTAVTNNDPEAFARSILGPKIGNPKLLAAVEKQLFQTVRKGMQLESVNESQELNKRTPSVRELAKKYATDVSVIHHQINRGVKVEFEHTNNIEIATEIAMDHLGEKLDYYKRLAKAENESVPVVGSGGKLVDRQVGMFPWDKETPVNEVADQPYRFISPVSTATTQKSMFQTDSGTTIQVFIQVDTGNGVADIGFFDATDKENPTIGVTGKGDAFRIFATVGSIVKQFVDKRKPPYISFSGKSSDAGRIKLYDMIAKNIGRYLREYKLIDSGFANGDKGYTFKRVAQENVSEVAKVKLSSDPNNFGAWVNDSGKPEKTIMIPINKLSGFEPDSKFDDPLHAKNLAKIVKAIKAGKELPPILVRRHGIDRFQVLDGHHRFKAYRMAGMKSIPARLVDPKNVSEEKKPKKPKTIIDGALKTLIAKGRSEDEAIADLKKEIDSKFYDLTETREGALNWLKSYLPTWPEYVLRDWLYRGLTAKEHDPSENPKAVVDRSLAGEGMSAQTQWKLMPDFEFKIEKLHPDTQRRINIRAGGSANPMKVPKDAERHATQAALAQQQGGVRKEPVIGKMTPQGFELIEGWHRTIQHFKQFPDGYRGPAWVAMNAKTESWSPMELAIMEGGHLLEEFDESLDETLKKVKGEWALVSRKNPKKVLQYYHGSGHPSKDWVSKVERRVHSFESIIEENAKPRVYLDMDGVLADFFGEWSRLAGVDHYKDINNAEESLQLVREHPTFWIDLPILPHAKALIKTVIEHYGEYRICSKPLEGDVRSKSGKMEWIRKHLSDMMPAEVILTADKAAFATQDGAPSILVDDYGVNINAWRNAGGIGLKYDDSMFPSVAKILTSIAKSGVVR